MKRGEQPGHVTLKYSPSLEVSAEYGAFLTTLGLTPNIHHRVSITRVVQRAVGKLEAKIAF